MSSTNKTNFIWSNKNAYVKYDNNMIIDIFQNNINLQGENSFGFTYLCINIFDQSEDKKLEYSERNSMYELRFNNILLEASSENFKSFYDFAIFCKYIINICENNQIDDDCRLLLLKKYDSLKK